MAEEQKAIETNIGVKEQKTRRQFVRTAAQVGITIPAAAGLLLTATTNPVEARVDSNDAIDSTAAVPEPTTLALLGSGLAAILVARR